MTALKLVDHPTPLLWLRGSHASGESAGVVRKLFQDAALNTGRVAAGWSFVVEHALTEIGETCVARNWDGFGATAVTLDTVENVRAVCHALFALVPNSVPAPEFTPQADGEVSVSWAPDADRIFAISIGSHSALNYAGQLGSGKSPHGVQHFSPDDVHSIDEIAGYLRELYSGTPAAAA